jgi:hypothetical protein
VLNVFLTLQPEKLGIRKTSSSQRYSATREVGDKKNFFVTKTEYLIIWARLGASILTERGDR